MPRIPNDRAGCEEITDVDSSPFVINKLALLVKDFLINDVAEKPSSKAWKKLLRLVVGSTSWCWVMVRVPFLLISVYVFWLLGYSGLERPH